MATKLFRPAVRTALRAQRPSIVSTTARRFLNSETAPSLYAAHARVVGARTGHVDGENLKVDLTMAKALGGPGSEGKTNPEELLAAAFGACFQSAMNAVAPSLGIKMPSKTEDSVVDSTVHLVGSLEELDLGLRVDLKVRVKGVEEEGLREVVRKAEEVCPFARAVKGNVRISTEVEVMH